MTEREREKKQEMHEREGTRRNYKRVSDGGSAKNNVGKRERMESQTEKSAGVG